jgi:hypothetical protein
VQIPADKSIYLKSLNDLARYWAPPDHPVENSNVWVGGLQMQTQNSARHIGVGVAIGIGIGLHEPHNKQGLFDPDTDHEMSGA